MGTAEPQSDPLFIRMEMSKQTSIFRVGFRLGWVVEVQSGWVFSLAGRLSSIYLPNPGIIGLKGLNRTPELAG